MAITLAQIWRHPIKSHGREALTSVQLKAGESMPFDRLWAIAHQAAKLQDGEWAGCVNFIRTAISPAHCAITATLNEQSETIVLSHPIHGQSDALNPDRDADALLAYSSRIGGDFGRTPTRVVRLETRSFTDTDYPSVSILNLASLAALESAVGAPMGVERWRGNLWIDGRAPWIENDLIGHRVQIGETVFDIIEPIVRCRVTETDALLGQYDIETRKHLRALNGNDNFGVYARVVESGVIAIDDFVEVLN